jgi:hypothetical protein
MDRSDGHPRMLFPAGVPAPRPLVRLVESHPRRGDQPSPRFVALRDALVAAWQGRRGGKYPFDGKADPAAIKRLVEWTSDSDDTEVLRRFALALDAPPPFHVDTIAQFATSRIWSHFAPPRTSAARSREFLGLDAATGKPIYAEAK